MTGMAPSSTTQIRRTKRSASARSRGRSRARSSAGSRQARHSRIVERGQGRQASDWAAPDTTLFRDCVDACNRCLAYCLRQGGHHAEFEHIGRLMDCLEVCITTADLAGRNSPVAPSLIQVCAEVAEDCAMSCDEHGGAEDAEMLRCSEACRDLAEWCLLQATATQA
jgi:hypothetical protein